MGLPTGELQTALIARYKADTTLTTLLGGQFVYDEDGVPTNTPFPYLVIFPITTQRGTAKAFGSDSVDTWMQVSIFTQAGGFASARAIAKEVYAATQEIVLSLTGGFRNFFIQFDNEQELTEPVAPLGGIPTQHIAQRYRTKTQG